MLSRGSDEKKSLHNFFWVVWEDVVSNCDGCEISCVMNEVLAVEEGV